MEIKQSEIRGLDDVCKVARELRHRCFTKQLVLSTEEKESSFKDVWDGYVHSVKSKFDRGKLSNEIYRQLWDLYDNQLGYSSRQKVKLP